MARILDVENSPSTPNSNSHLGRSGPARRCPVSLSSRLTNCPASPFRWSWIRRPSL